MVSHRNSFFQATTPFDVSVWFSHFISCSFYQSTMPFDIGVWFQFFQVLFVLYLKASFWTCWQKKPIPSVFIMLSRMMPWSHNELNFLYYCSPTKKQVKHPGISVWVAAYTLHFWDILSNITKTRDFYAGCQNIPINSGNSPWIRVLLPIIPGLRKPKTFLQF